MRIDPKALLDTWSRHDFEALPGFFTSDATYEDIALDKRAVGHDAIVAFARDGVEHFSSDIRFEPTDVVELGQGIMWKWTMSGTNDRDSVDPPFPATNKPYEVHGVTVAIVHDGKIRLNVDHWDLNDLLKQLIEEPAAEAAPAS